MKKYMSLIILFLLLEEPLRAEHDYWTTFGEGMLVSALMCWQITRAWTDKENQKKEVDPRTTLPCGHDYICPACQLENEVMAKKRDEDEKGSFRRKKRVPLKRADAS
jgi:hypothetical protein